MFNDLNNSGAPTRPVVDDIFAETDKPSPNAQTDIETHRVGLATGGETLSRMETDSEGPKRNYLKMIIIAVVVLALIGGGYFVYLQLSKTSSVDNNLNATSNSNTQTTNNPAPKTDETGFVTVIPEITPGSQDGFASSTEVIPGSINGTTTVSTSTEIIPVSTIDSDQDGLTDAEEKVYRTNPNVIDTDNDGLSDYEEVMVYHTDPLNSDTDGDGFADGLEIKGGYDPNVKGGKLPGTPAIK